MTTRLAALSLTSMLLLCSTITAAENQKELADCSAWAFNQYRLGMTMKDALAIRPADLKRSAHRLPKGYRRALVRSEGLEGKLIFDKDGVLTEWVQLTKQSDYRVLLADLTGRFGPPDHESRGCPGAVWISEECKAQVRIDGHCVGNLQSLSLDLSSGGWYD